MGFDSPSFNPESNPKEEKIKQLFGHCFEIFKFEENDLIPVGGTNFLSDETNIKVQGDFENFKEFFLEAHEAAAKYKLPELKEWLAKQDIEIDEKLFAKLFAFTKKFEKKYPNRLADSEMRTKIYREKNTELKLSDIFNANSAECAEIAALAQKFLQSDGVSSSYFSGDVLWNKDEEFSEEHSFIIIRQGDKTYIYDPTNPIKTASEKFPSVYSVEANFDQEMAKGQKRFVTARNILSKNEAFYGVNNGTSVRAEEHII